MVIDAQKDCVGLVPKLELGNHDQGGRSSQEMVVVHLTASRFFGGPERQMLELARSMSDRFRSIFVSFSEGGLCQAFLGNVRSAGFPATALKHDTPHLLAALLEVVRLLRSWNVDVICCHRYKANMLGVLAARRVRIPVVSVSRGWTAESFRVRLFEKLDRFALQWMDRVVCVSEGQVAKVHRAGVAKQRTSVIRNAIRTDRFAIRRQEHREHVRHLLGNEPDRIVGAIGRLSPEKGFDVLVESAAKLAHTDLSVGFVVFGEGPLRDALARQIRTRNLDHTFVLAGFYPQLDRYLPHLDLVVLPSFTEGLPNAVLEAFGAGVPVVATAVGGTPELVEDGVNGYLVPPGDPSSLAQRIADVLSDDVRRREMGLRGRQRVREQFSFASQAESYQRLFDSLAGWRVKTARPGYLNRPLG